MEIEISTSQRIEEGLLPENELEGKYLTFWTDGQLLGLSIAHVVQIVGIQRITTLPEAPHYVKGVIDLRGLIIPVVDVRLRLGKMEAEYDERTCIIVTDIDGAHGGLIVDAVDSVVTIPPNQMSKPPQLSGRTDGFTTEIAKLDSRVALLMDPCKLIGDEILPLLAGIR